jgi:hypothetical protein
MDKNERRAHVGALLNALPAAWTPLQVELQYLRARYVDDLIVCNNEETRGKVKMIDEMLRLPNTLRQEMNHLAQSLPE